MPQIPPGGVVLGQQLPQFTEHITTFKSCTVGVEAIVDAENKVTGYRLHIHDARENHLYFVPMEQTLKDQLRTSFFQLPEIGEKVPGA